MRACVRACECVCVRVYVRARVLWLWVRVLRLRVGVRHLLHLRLRCLRHRDPRSSGPTRGGKLDKVGCEDSHPISRNLSINTCAIHLRGISIQRLCRDTPVTPAVRSQRLLATNLHSAYLHSALSSSSCVCLLRMGDMKWYGLFQSQKLADHFSSVASSTSQPPCSDISSISPLGSIE